MGSMAAQINKSDKNEDLIKVLKEFGKIKEEIEKIKKSQEQIERNILKDKKTMSEEDKKDHCITKNRMKFFEQKGLSTEANRDLSKIQKKDDIVVVMGLEDNVKDMVGVLKQRVGKMKTHDKYVDEVRELVGDEYTVIGTYQGSTKKIKIRHNVCGTEYEIMPNAFTSKGNRCPECAKSLKGKGRKSQARFVSEIYQLVKDEYTVLEEYRSSKTKLLMRHNVCGHEWKVSPHLFLSGTRCPKCADAKKKEEIGRTHDEYIAKINEIHNGEYTILGKYVNGNTKVLAQHNECGYQWEVRAQSLLGNTRCPKCYGVLRKTQAEFENQVKEVSNNEYIVIGEYINNRTDIEIQHQVCGHIFKVTPNAFLQGKRCPICKFRNKE